MTTKLLLKCDGCFAEHKTTYFKREFYSVSGRSYGFGSWKVNTIDELVAPTGWQWMDPFTGCTYCPNCWAEILRGEAS